MQFTQRLSFCTNMKDQISKLRKSYAVYEFNCPGCKYSYISKTEHNLCTMTEEHACSEKESAIYNHISNCSYYSYIENLSVSIMTHLIKQYLVSTQCKVTPK